MTTQNNGLAYSGLNPLPLNQLATPDYSQGLAYSGMSYPTLAERQNLGKGGTALNSSYDPALVPQFGQGNTQFFNPDNSVISNIGDIGNLAASSLGLASMWKNLKAQDLNYKNVEQQMADRRDAFNRSKARQDRTTAAIQAANDAAALNN